MLEKESKSSVLVMVPQREIVWVSTSQVLATATRSEFEMEMPWETATGSGKESPRAPSTAMLKAWTTVPRKANLMERCSELKTGSAMVSVRASTLGFGTAFG